jgi:hypothetical protein
MAAININSRLKQGIHIGSQMAGVWPNPMNPQDNRKLNPEKYFTMKKFLIICLISISSVAKAETAQQFCDQMNVNTQSMYHDLSSAEFQSGQVTYDQLVQNYGRQTTMYLSQLNLEVMKIIYEKRNEVSAQDVNQYVYNRCANDYTKYQAWWKARSTGRPSDILAPSVY